MPPFLLVHALNLYTYKYLCLARAGKGRRGGGRRRMQAKCRDHIRGRLAVHARSETSANLRRDLRQHAMKHAQIRSRYSYFLSRSRLL